MSTQTRTLQEFRTALSPDEVLARARQFFVERNTLYAAFPEKEGPGFLTLRGQGGEEIALAAVAVDGGSLVTGSSYMFDAQIGRFFSTLPPLPEVK
jgi:hypothetical protein